ncbi:MAG TPA: dihydropteroate synthase [Actinomycetota bacterium]|nr:dihydropteroate synthase [Actinomycetota bacterium]
MPPEPARSEAGAASSRAAVLRLGDRGYDISHRAVVVGILNRTRDSFYDGDAYFELDALLRHAERLVDDGADVLEVGARAAGVGVYDVPEQEEIDLAASTLSELAARFDVALGVDTRRSSVARAAFGVGAVIGNDMSGFTDPGYLPAAAAAGAAVVATHTRLPPGVPDPEPEYRDVVEDVVEAVAGLGRRAEEAGVAPDRVIVDPGLDLGKTWRQSLELLAAFDRFAALGYPLLLGASNKIFLGRALGLEVEQRTFATVAACSYGVERGARVLRVHDARGARHAADLYAALATAGSE